MKYKVTETGDVFVASLFVGNIKDMYEQRSAHFPTLESVAKYRNKYGKMPWHLRVMCKQNGWDVIPTKGYAIVIEDKKNNFFLRVDHAGAMETGLLC